MIDHKLSGMQNAPLDADYFGLRDIANVAIVWLMGITAMYVFVTRPMIQEISSLKTRIQDMETGMQQVAGLRDSAWRTNDLLSALTQQTHAISRAEKSLQDMRTLRQSLEQEASELAPAFDSLSQMGRLRQNVIAEASYLDQTRNLIARLGTFETQNQLFAMELDSCSNHMKSMEGKLLELQTLKDSLIQLTTQVDQAQSVSDRLDSLTEQLTQSSEQTADAQMAYNNIDTLRENLIVSASNTQAACEQVSGLIGLQEKLIGRSQDLYKAIETLETMSDFQDILSKQVISLDQVRRDLVDIAGLETAAKQAMNTIEPLLQMTQLRRLNTTEMREVARHIMQQRQLNPEMLAEGNSPAEEFISITNETLNIPLTPMPEETDALQISAVPDPIDVN